MNSDTTTYLLLFSRLCVGGVFLVSAVGKMLDKEGTAASMARYPFLPRWSGRVIAEVFPYLELLVGLCLIMGLFTRAASVTAVLLFAVFTSLITYDLAHNSRASCHCFGRLSDEKLTPVAVARNAFLMLLALFVAVAFDGWLSLDTALGLNPAASQAGANYPGGSEAVPVALLALAAVGVIVLGGQAVNMIRTTLRGMGFR